MVSPTLFALLIRMNYNKFSVFCFFHGNVTETSGLEEILI